MEHSDFISRVESVVDNLYEDSIIGGKVTSTVINQDDDGFFISVFDDDESIRKSHFDDEIQEELKEAVDLSLRDFKIMDEKLSENSNKDTCLRFSRHEETDVYVDVTIKVSIEDRTIDDYAELFTKDSTTHDVEVSDVESAVIRFDPIWGSFDSTCYYSSTEPHTIYSNISSLEEYAEYISDGTDQSRGEIMSQDSYTMHYHPSDSEVLESLRQDFSEYKDAIRSTIDSTKAITKIEIREDEIEIELTQQYRARDMI